MAATATIQQQLAIRSLESLRLTDVAIAGGKGANLGELIGNGFPVPPGFVNHRRRLSGCDAGRRRAKSSTLRG